MDELIDNSNPNINSGANLPLPNATATLVLGIISLATFWLYGIIGIICGIIAIALHQKDKRIHTTNPASYGAAFKNSKAGFICGIIGLALSVLFLLFVVVLVALVFNEVSRFPR